MLLNLSVRSSVRYCLNAMQCNVPYITVLVLYSPYVYIEMIYIYIFTMLAAA